MEASFMSDKFIRLLKLNVEQDSAVPGFTI